MILSKEDYIYYLKCDKKALGIERKQPRFLFDEIWKCQIFMRRCEYYLNCRKDPVGKFFFFVNKFFFRRLCLKCGFSLPFNVFGPGLSIAHIGQVTVNGSARIGKNCRIHEGVTIGVSNAFNLKAATIGDNCFIGSGAKILGDITISDNVCIGANAVVTKSILEIGVTVGGVPAKKISDNDSRNLMPGLYEDTE